MKYEIVPMTPENRDLILSEQKVIGLQAKTYTDLVKLPSLRLERIQQAFGEDSAVGMVTMLLSDLCSVMAFKTTPEMILTAAEMIVSDYPDTKVAAFHLFKKDVMYGNIGAPMGKTFRMDAKVLLEMWADFYKKMSTAIAEFIEAKHKDIPEVTINKDKVIPMPEYVKATYQKIEQEKAAKAKELDENRPKPMVKKTLDEIAASMKIDPLVLAEAIRKDAEMTFNKPGEVSGLTFQAFLGIKLGQVTFEARKDPKFLKEYISTHK